MKTNRMQNKLITPTESGGSGKKMGRPRRPFELWHQFESRPQFEEFWAEHKSQWRRRGSARTADRAVVETWACPAHKNFSSVRDKGIFYVII
jgi:hypothetical protein